MARERFDALDGMRGIAALTVMIYHLALSRNIPYLHHAYIAVDLFFILSGFVITHRYGKALAAGLSVPLYTARRIIRLFPLMAASLILGGPLLVLYEQSGRAGYSLGDASAATIANLFFVPWPNHNIINDAAGSLPGALFPANPPLWSIFFELLASVGFVVLRRLHVLLLLAFCAVSLAAMLLLYAGCGPDTLPAGGFGWGTSNFFGGFPRVCYGFSCGMLVYRARRVLGRLVFPLRPGSGPAGVIGCYLALVAVLLCPTAEGRVYYIVAIAALAPSLVAWGATVDCGNLFLRDASRLLGRISYPVYCLHSPVQRAVLLMNDDGRLTSQTHLSPEVCSVACTLLLAVLVGGLDARLRTRMTMWMSRYRDSDGSRATTGEPTPTSSM